MLSTWGLCAHRRSAELMLTIWDVHTDCAFPFSSNFIYAWYRQVALGAFEQSHGDMQKAAVACIEHFPSRPRLLVKGWLPSTRHRALICAWGPRLQNVPGVKSSGFLMCFVEAVSCSLMSWPGPPLKRRPRTPSSTPATSSWIWWRSSSPDRQVVALEDIVILTSYLGHHHLYQSAPHGLLHYSLDWTNAGRVGWSFVHWRSRCIATGTPTASTSGRSTPTRAARDPYPSSISPSRTGSASWRSHSGWPSVSPVASMLSTSSRISTRWTTSATSRSTSTFPAFGSHLNQNNVISQISEIPVWSG